MMRMRVGETVGEYIQRLEKRIEELERALREIADMGQAKSAENPTTAEYWCEQAIEARQKARKALGGKAGE